MNVERLARQAFSSEALELGDVSAPDASLYIDLSGAEAVDFCRAFAALALEEAAKVCDAAVAYYEGEAAQVSCGKCAAAIRALMEPTR